MNDAMRFMNYTTTMLDASSSLEEMMEPWQDSKITVVNEGANKIFAIIHKDLSVNLLTKDKFYSIDPIELREAIESTAGGQDDIDAALAEIMGCLPQ